MRDADDWTPGVADWGAAARLRREQALALSADERLGVVEEMIRLAIAAGTFHPKAPHAVRVTLSDL